MGIVFTNIMSEINATRAALEGQYVSPLLMNSKFQI